MKQALVGNVYSKTNWVGLVIAIIGYLQLPAVHQSLLPWAKPEHLAVANTVLGLLIIVMRNLTVESVTAKGARVLAGGAE